MKRLALFTIALYQRFVSPHKGFCCAYRAQTGRASCSTLGYRAIRRLGVWQGIAVLRQRLFKCGVVHRRHSDCYTTPQPQGGFCDMSCDMDCSSCDSLGDCGNWGSRKNNDKEKWVYIPANSGLGRPSKPTST